MKCRLEEVAREQEKKGKRVWLGYGKIRIEGEWWFWDKEKEVLKDRKRMVKGEQGKGEERKREGGG